MAKLTESLLRKIIKEELSEMMDNDEFEEPGESPNREHIDELKGYLGNALFELEQIERQSNPAIRNGIANAMKLISKARVIAITKLD